MHEGTTAQYLLQQTLQHQKPETLSCRGAPVCPLSSTMPCYPLFADCVLHGLTVTTCVLGHARLQSRAVLPSAFQCHRAGRHAYHYLFLQIALELEKVALNDEYFIKRKLYPNVDFFSGELDQACMTTNDSASKPLS